MQLTQAGKAGRYAEEGQHHHPPGTGQGQSRTWPLQTIKDCGHKRKERAGEESTGTGRRMSFAADKGKKEGEEVKKSTMSFWVFNKGTTVFFHSCYCER